ncbi:nuclear transport factor 2 family protein [Sorangium sp. So ce388]|uniref:nuclear transport factor 2 family protein n=1 Tax=Sorangium sp. So ce388 TaxID=3133309 RepID=UPI003F5C0737
MQDPEFARRFAQEWIAAWNSHDLERIFSHYTDDFEMSSPFIVERMHEPSGTLKGKAAIRAYWEKGLAADPSLRFELEAALPGVDSLTILYRTASGRRVAEVVVFNEQRQVIKGLAHYE